MRTDDKTYGKIWREAAQAFAAEKIDNARQEAQILLRHVAEFDAAQLIGSDQKSIPAPTLEKFDRLVRRRLSGEPVARLIGHWAFYGLEFELNDHTLVPRQDTELLVDTGLQHLENLAHEKRARVLDLGTGSGCVLLSLLKNFERASGIGADINGRAIEMAQHNGGRLRVDQRALFVISHWYAALPADEKFDLIVSNPPYIASSVIKSLAREVNAHDPMLALDGGDDGLVAYRAILKSAKSWLKTGGMLAVEIGYDQGESVSALFKENGFGQIKSSGPQDVHKVHILKDLAGNDRVVFAIN